MRSLLIGTALGLAAIAGAQEITYTGTVYGDEPFTLSGDPGVQAWAGQIMITTSTTGSTIIPTYCITPNSLLTSPFSAVHFVALSNSFYSGGTHGLSTAQQNQIEYLADMTVGSKDAAAEVQLAIWSVEGETFGGSAYTTAIQNGVTADVNLATAHDANPTAYTLFTPNGPNGYGTNGQNYLSNNLPSQALIAAGGTVTPFGATPEPVTTCLGIAGVGLFVRRRLKASQA